MILLRSGTIDHRSINLIMAGDLNELGQLDDPNVFNPFFSDFGKLQISTALPTCCYDSDPKWIHSFDRIVTNSLHSPIANILEDRVRGGLGCLNRFSASISGASAGVRLPSGAAAG